MDDFLDWNLFVQAYELGYGADPDCGHWDDDPNPYEGTYSEL